MTTELEAKIIQHMKPTINHALLSLQDASTACLQLRNQGPWCLSESDYKEIDKKIWEIEQILKARMEE